jgi:hypothetical protein
VLIGEATNRLAADAMETREIDSVLVVGKTEPQRIFELLGRKGDVARDLLALRDAYAEALDAYRWQGLGEGASRVRTLSRRYPMRRAQQVVPGTHRAVLRYRAMRGVEWRLVVSGKVGQQDCQQGLAHAAEAG